MISNFEHLDKLNLKTKLVYQIQAKKQEKICSLIQFSTNSVKILCDRKLYNSLESKFN